MSKDKILLNPEDIDKIAYGHFVYFREIINQIEKKYPDKKWKMLKEFVNKGVDKHDS